MKKILSIICALVITMVFSSEVFALSQKQKNESIKITKTSKHLRSRLSKEYEGFVYTVENISDKPVTIENVSTKDSLTSEAAYLSIKRSSFKTGAKTIGTGLTYVIPTLTLSLWGSIILAPVKMVANTCGNIGAKQESKRYDIDTGVKTLNPGESVKIKTIAVQHHSPEIIVLYKTNDNENLSRLEF